MRCIWTSLAILVSCNICGPAFAAAERTFEVTPFVGYRSGGEFDVLSGTGTPDASNDLSFGLALGMSRRNGNTYELLYSREDTNVRDATTDFDLSIEHLHLGVTSIFNEGDRVTPFISVGVGATHFNPEGSGDNETRFSVALGFGVGVPISKSIRFRLELRNYLVAMGSESQMFCTSGAAGGSCLVRNAGSTLYQFEGLAGVVIGF